MGSRPKSRWPSWRRGSKPRDSPFGEPRNSCANTSPEIMERAAPNPKRGGKVEIRFRERGELDALMTLLVPKEPT